MYAIQWKRAALLVCTSVASIGNAGYQAARYVYDTQPSIGDAVVRMGPSVMHMSFATAALCTVAATVAVARSVKKARSLPKQVTSPVNALGQPVDKDMKNTCFGLPGTDEVLGDLPGVIFAPVPAPAVDRKVLEKVAADKRRATYLRTLANS